MGAGVRDGGKGAGQAMTPEQEAARKMQGAAPTGAYLCESAELNARYWLEGARNARNNGDANNAVLYAEQSINAWKNLAYSLAVKAHYYLLQSGQGDLLPNPPAAAPSGNKYVAPEESIPVGVEVHHAAPSEGETPDVGALLVEVARMAFHLLDDSEERDDGEIVVTGDGAGRLNEALQALESLPPRPGYVSSGPANAEYALERRLREAEQRAERAEAEAKGLRERAEVLEFAAKRAIRDLFHAADDVRDAEMRRLFRERAKGFEKAVGNTADYYREFMRRTDKAEMEAERCRAALAALEVAMTDLHPEVQQGIDKLAKWYADHYKIGLSARSDLRYIAALAVQKERTELMNDAEALRDEKGVIDEYSLGWDQAIRAVKEAVIRRRWKP